MVRKLKKIWTVFYPSERYVFIGASFILVFSLIFNYFLLARERAAEMPIPGGKYREGIVGQPMFINPVIVANDVDRDIVSLIFSSITDLAESIKSDEEGKVWTIRLKENVLWHDGEPLTSDDVIFTIDAIQDPDANSPLFKTWQGVVAERVSVQELRLLIRTPYAFFDNNLRELFIIPKHIFADVPPANFKLSDYNLQPIGSGPFRFEKFEKRRDGFITDFILERNETYFGEKPLIETMILKFYADEERLINAMNNRQIDGFGGIDARNLSKIKIRHELREIPMPSYYAVFFNANVNPVLKDKNVRLALRHATDKGALLLNILDGHGEVANGPLPSYMEGYDSNIYPEDEFSLEKANEILEADGWLMSEDGIRTKEINKTSMKLDFVIVVPQIDFLIKTAEGLRGDWSKIGVRANLVVLEPRAIASERIRTRDYEMLIFGNILNGVPDLFSFWHSSERYYPGLNLSLYENKTADALLESIRLNGDPEKRRGDLVSVQSLIYNDIPAIFLYSPNYLYVSVPALEGFDASSITTPSHRFEQVEQWYLKSVRILQF